MNIPMENYGSEQATEVHPKDCFQTPPEALALLAPWLHRAGMQIVWEPAAGQGYLVRWLTAAGFGVVDDDLDRGMDYFLARPPVGVRGHVTNVPFSLKYRWIKKACQEGLPFALLVPSSVFFAGRKAVPLITKYKLQFLSPLERLSYKTPNLPWERSNPQLHTSWLCHKLDLPALIHWVEVPDRAQVLADWGIAIEKDSHAQLTLFGG